MNALNIFKRIRTSMTKQNVLVAGVFVLALAGAIGMGHATKQGASAETSRDCSVNSVDYKDLNGGCGATTPQELIADIRNNDPGDLQNTYSYFGLTSDKYDRFASSARQGVAKANGDVVVDDQVVMTDAWSIGRTPFSYSEELQIGSTMFYKSAHTKVLQGKDHDVMVMFDENGTAEFAALNACGNAVSGEKKLSDGLCKKLNMTKVENKKDTYNFTTDVDLIGYAKVTKVVYTFSDGTIVEKAKQTDAVDHTFTKSGTAKVDVYVSLPGGKTKVVSGDNCIKKITVTPPKTPMCTTPGKEKYLPNAPECEECKPGIPKNDARCEECKPGVPKNDARCETTPPPAELPKTGMGNVLSLFAGTSVAGAAVHRVFSSRRRR